MLLALVLFSWLISKAVAMNLLLFGGNGFMGSETSRILLDAGHSLTLVNRGFWRWDGAELIKPKVSTKYCDRMNPASCKAFMDDLNDAKFDAVVDFSAFEPSAVEPFYDWLKKHVTGLYIYISTDSVYEVSELKDAQSEPSQEVDAVRPADASLRTSLNRKDSYGDEKLQVEELLIRKQKEGGLPYVFLRLPDVLGARDGTGRFWGVQLWVQYLMDMLPLPIANAPEDLQTSYVYARDVGRIISRILTLDQDSIKNQAYNLGYPNPIRFSELVHSIAQAAGIDPGDVNILGDHEDRFFFPSVTRGSVNVSKAERVLGWTVTPWEQMVQETVDFYHQALVKFPDEADSAVEDLLESLDDGDLSSEQRAVVQKRIQTARAKLSQRTEL